MTTYTVVFALPPRCCGGNYAARSAKQRITDSERIAAYRNQCTALVKDAFPSWQINLPFTRPIRITWQWYLRSQHRQDKLIDKLDPPYRPKDFTNAIHAVKYPTDAFVHAGVLVDDSIFYVPDMRVELYSHKDGYDGRCALVAVLEEME